MVLCAERVTKDAGQGETVVHILRGVDLCVAAGEVIAIMGPSGSGKSTLLGLLGGLDRPTSGCIVVNGVDITGMSENRLADVRNREIGFVFQTFNLIPTLTARENVELPIQLGPRRGVKPARRAAELLRLVGLSERAAHRPGQLSGGEQQRVAIARALANDPALLLADEPTGNLDSANGERVIDLLLDLRAHSGKTIVVVTHDDTIARRCDRILLLQDGQFAPQGDGAERLASIQRMSF